MAASRDRSSADLGRSVDRLEHQTLRDFLIPFSVPRVPHTRIARLFSTPACLRDPENPTRAVVEMQQGTSVIVHAPARWRQSRPRPVATSRPVMKTRSN